MGLEGLLSLHKCDHHLSLWALHLRVQLRAGLHSTLDLKLVLELSQLLLQQQTRLLPVTFSVLSGASSPLPAEIQPFEQRISSSSCRASAFGP